MNTSLKIRDIIEAPPVQTVISLEEGQTSPQAITDSFVFTPEVTSHFAVLADSLLKDHGRGYFLQGDFGSGKSHFLATFASWLEDRPGAEALTQKHGGLRRVKESGRRFLSVDISLVNFRGTTSLEEIIVKKIESALASHGLDVQLTPLAAFLNYFKTILKEKTYASDFASQVGMPSEESDPSDFVDSYINSHPRQAYSEGVRFMKQIGIKMPEMLIEERDETLARVLRAIKDAGFDGLVLVLDELSEFFRSKADARLLNEDARTLQLLGELTASRPLWIIAAVQESIERTGDIAQVTFRKIKDRFPVKFILSTLHIKALIPERLVKRQLNADQEIKKIFDYYKNQFPSFSWNFEDFRACYPVHPVTINLLKDLGDLFSSHRGIVDFVHSQIAGNKERNIAGILDRPAHELLGPDSIYDHFAPRIAEFSAFNLYTRHVIPHLDEVIESEIDEPEDIALAKRIVRIIVLYKIHPVAETPVAGVLTELAGCALSGHDPAYNVRYVSETILDILVEKSKFIVKNAPAVDDGYNAVYTVVTEEDPAKALKARISHTASEIPVDDTRLLTEPFSEMPESASWPGPALVRYGLARHITWLHSQRRAFVCFWRHSIPDKLFMDSEGKTSLSEFLAEELSGGQTDFAVVISLGKTDFLMEHTAVWEIPVPFDEGDVSVLREFLAVRLIARDLNPSNPADAPLVQIADETSARLAPAAYQAALNVFYSGKFAGEQIVVEPVIRKLKRFDRLLDIAGEYLLEKRYPAYREVAPQKVIPALRLYQRLLDEFITPGSIGFIEARKRGLVDAIEGLSAPLGLVQVKSGSYIFSPDQENHPLLATVFGLINTAGATRLTGFVHSLQTGKFGLPVETISFLLSALATGGLITILKNGRAVSLESLRANVIEYADAIAPGEVIGKNDRETLIKECGFLAPGSQQWESLGLRQQREAWQNAVKFRNSVKNMAADMEKRLSALGEFSAFEAFDLSSLWSQISAIKSLADEIKVSYTAREGLERFLQSWRGLGLTSHNIEFLTKLRRFLANQAEQFVFINHYIRHRSVEIACSEDKNIASPKDSIRQFLEKPDVLIENDNPSVLSDAFDLFRAGYAGFYSNKHAAHYKGYEKKAVSRFAKRALVLLKRLASIEILDRPAGLEKLFRDLDPPIENVCKRNLAEELLRSPVCNCGFIPGETKKPEIPKDPEKEIETYLDEYLKILKNPAVREAISARIFALADSEPAEVKRLKRLNAFLEDKQPSSTGLLDLLDDETANEISKSLSGRVLIEKRGLKELVSRLAGRRLAPNQVLETVKEWTALSKENTVIAIDDEAGILSEKGSGRANWWPAIHPELFKEKDRSENREVEEALKRQFPAEKLGPVFSHADDETLSRFIINEPFHTNAIREAWLLLTERVLTRSGQPATEKSWLPDSVSRHFNPKTAAAINDRINVLRQVIQTSSLLLPDRLRVRIPLASILADSWATVQLRETVLDKIKTAARSGEEWLATLSPLEPIPLKDNPIVIILDGVSPDVWLEVMANTNLSMPVRKLSWFCLDVAPLTSYSISAIFGFSEDARDEFKSLGIPYYQVSGNEKHKLSDILPGFQSDRPVVIHVSLVDAGAHSALMRIDEMPAAISIFIDQEMPKFIDVCEKQNRRLVITTDHGFSLTRSGLSHGQGSVYELAIFRAEWPFGDIALVV